MKRVALNALALIVIVGGAMMLGARPASALDDEGPFVLNPDPGTGGGGGAGMICCTGPTCWCCGSTWAGCGEKPVCHCQ